MVESLHIHLLYLLNLICPVFGTLKVRSQLCMQCRSTLEQWHFLFAIEVVGFADHPVLAMQVHYPSIHDIVKGLQPPWQRGTLQLRMES